MLVCLSAALVITINKITADGGHLTSEFFEGHKGLTTQGRVLFDNTHTYVQLKHQPKTLWPISIHHVLLREEFVIGLVGGLINLSS